MQHLFIYNRIIIPLKLRSGVAVKFQPLVTDVLSSAGNRLNYKHK